MMYVDGWVCANCGLQIDGPVLLPVRCKCSILGPNSSHWLPIHRYSIENFNCWNEAQAQSNYAIWSQRIPSYGCSCEQNWRMYTRACPPDFSSPVAFFQWTVKAHNHVSIKHAKKPTMSLDEAEGLYSAPWVVPRSRAILTCAFGEHLDVLAITQPLMQQYANRCNAELITLRDNQFPHWTMGNKWRASSYAWRYEQLLYLDSDVIISDAAPNIFDLGFAFAAQDERPTYDYRPNWYRSEMLDLFKSQGVEHELAHCANGGVIFMTRETRKLYSKPSKNHVRYWCTDQYWLSYKMETNSDSVTWLDDRWNWGFIRKDWWRGLKDAFFIHLNGSRPLQYRKVLAARIAGGDYRYYPMANVQGWFPPHEIPASV